MFKLLLLFVLFASLFSRENPFEDINSVMDSKIQSLKPFKEELFHFESSARILNTITFAYTNLDGSIGQKTISVEKLINWHDLFKLSRIDPIKEPTHALISIKIPQAASNIDGIKPLPTELLKLSLDGYEASIFTKDELLRVLSTQNPSVIYLDFKHKQRYFYQVKRLDNPPFRKIEFSSHLDFYRIKIFLDGKYGYKILKGNGQYTLTLY